jgi:phosphopantothenoylcysteine decarboxylase/phosphopantothenate--cysteine ligase
MDAKREFPEDLDDSPRDNSASERISEGQLNVLLGVTGCIAAYKACEVLRGLQKAGVHVKVVMTEHAESFVGSTTFKALTHEPVAVGLFDEPGDPIHHISLAAETDLFLICPATANVIAKIANGVADDLLTTTALATEAPLVIAPAMNVHMWDNDRTQQNIALLKARGVRIIGPDDGHLACGYDGVGKLAPAEQVVAGTLEELALHVHDMEGRSVLVTAGPTYEPIDPVRFIGNRSSGRTGYAIAAEAARRGAHVTLVTGPVNLPAPFGVDMVHVQTAEEMLAAARVLFYTCDAAVFSAAVADYRPAVRADKKIKKDIAHPEKGLTLTLVRNPDIIATLAVDKAFRDSALTTCTAPVYVVGFAAETGDPVSSAREKLVNKHADLIVANDVSRPELGFGTDDNRVWFVDADQTVESPVLSKRQIAQRIIDRISDAIRVTGSERGI